MDISASTLVNNVKKRLQVNLDNGEISALNMDSFVFNENVIKVTIALPRCNKLLVSFINGKVIKRDAAVILSIRQQINDLFLTDITY